MAANCAKAYASDAAVNVARSACRSTAASASPGSTTSICSSSARRPTPTRSATPAGTASRSRTRCCRDRRGPSRNAGGAPAVVVGVDARTHPEAPGRQAGADADHPAGRAEPAAQRGQRRRRAAAGTRAGAGAGRRVPGSRPAERDRTQARPGRPQRPGTFGPDHQGVRRLHREPQDGRRPPEGARGQLQGGLRPLPASAGDRGRQARIPTRRSRTPSRACWWRPRSRRSGPSCWSSRARSGRRRAMAASSTQAVQRVGVGAGRVGAAVAGKVADMGKAGERVAEAAKAPIGEYAEQKAGKGVDAGKDAAQGGGVGDQAERDRGRCGHEQRRVQPCLREARRDGRRAAGARRGGALPVRAGDGGAGAGEGGAAARRRRRRTLHARRDRREGGRARGRRHAGQGRRAGGRGRAGDGAAAAGDREQAAERPRCARDHDLADLDGRPRRTRGCSTTTRSRNTWGRRAQADRLRRLHVPVGDP